MKIPVKFALAFSIIIIAAIGITSAFSIEYVESSVIKSHIEQMRSNVALKSQEIQNLHDRASEDLVFTLKNPLFVEYFDLPETKSGNVYRDGTLQFSDEQNKIRNELEQWIYHFQNKFQVDETCIIDSTGQEHARLVLKKIAPDDELSAEESGSPFFDPSFTINKDEVHIQYPYVSPDTQRWVFAYTSPVVLGDGEKPAFYHFEMPISIFQDLMDTDVGRMYVIDPSGFIVADSDPTSANANNADDDSVTELIPGDYFPSVQSISSSSEFASLVDEMIFENNGVGQYHKDGEIHYVVYEKLPTFGWILAYEKPTSLMLVGDVSLSQLSGIIILVSVIITIIGIVIVFVLSLKITRPLNLLSKWSKTQNVKDLQKLPVITGDEIGDVTTSLNLLIDKINDNEKQIAEQFEKLKELDIKKDEFASMVTHELKTPLTPILGFCSALLKKGLLGDLTPKQAQAVETISKNTKHLNRLIGDLLDVEKLELGKMKFDYSEFNVNDLLDDVLTSVNSSAKAKDIQIINTSKEDILNIKSDKTRISQVLNNLLYNAIDFVQNISGKIEINATDNGSEILFSVKDNGIGMSEEAQKGLFQKFYQTDTSRTRKHGGSGLGLSICHGIISALGGKIWCESIINQGSTFYFTIPKVMRNENTSN